MLCFWWSLRLSMGAGKSSVGRALGERLNWVFEDLDDRIEAREGRTVAEIFRDSGESEFRRAEHAALEHVLHELRGGVARIVALGGGAFAQKENAALLRGRPASVPTVFWTLRWKTYGSAVAPKPAKLAENVPCSVVWRSFATSTRFGTMRTRRHSCGFKPATARWKQSPLKLPKPWA